MPRETKNEPNMMNIKTEKTNLTILRTVGECAAELGYKAYAVGGFVRDMVMGGMSADIDFVCVGSVERPETARPGIEVANLAANKLGVVKVEEFKNFGTAHFIYDGKEVEFVGARKESYDRGSRKPVIENGTLDDDLERRDFTINAIAYCVNPGEYGFIDKFNGKKDINDRIIRTPLEPGITFSDDPLRMLRAIRFAVRFGFNIDHETYNGIKLNAHRLSIISAERITSELDKILMFPDPARGILILHDTGLLNMFLPEVSQLYGRKERDGVAHKDIFFHTLGVLKHVAERDGSLNARKAALLHDIGKISTRAFEDGGWTFKYHEKVGADMVDDIFKRLKMPMDDMEHVKKLVSMHMRPQTLTDESTDSAIRRLVYDAGDDLEDLLLLCESDVTSGNEDKVKRIKGEYDRLRERIKEIDDKDHVRNFRMPIGGDDIMSIFNLSPCKTVGAIKEEVKNAILDGELENDREKALEYLKQKHEKEKAANTCILKKANEIFNKPDYESGRFIISDKNISQS